MRVSAGRGGGGQRSALRWPWDSARTEAKQDEMEPGGTEGADHLPRQVFAGEAG